MAAIVFILCALTSAACAFLLLRAYRQTNVRLLLWSGLCFVGFALSNTLLYIDIYATPSTTDLSVIRAIPNLVGISLLLYGLIWDDKS